MVATARMSMVKLSVKGLAKYMTSGPATQRKVLRDFKYPDPEGAAQAKYYREAGNCIVAYHQNSHDEDWLHRKADQLETRAGRQGGQSAIRLRHNASGLRHYARAFGRKAYEILPELNLDLTYGPVRITVAPELHVLEKESEKIVKLDFATKAPDGKLVRIITQAMFEAVIQHGLDLPASSVLYMDVPRHKIHKGARMGARLTRDIEAACQNITAIWDGL